MSRYKRKIIKIDRDKCDGCGLCAQACHEGAIQMVEGKAELVSEIYCDGLGDCIGECPQDAITIEEREAEAFDAEAVAKHLQKQKSPQPCASGAGPHRHPPAGGCPGSKALSLRTAAAERTKKTKDTETEARPQVSPQLSAVATSHLSNWPVQLRLLPLHAPYLAGANLTLCADCVPFAYPDFHRRFLKDRVAVMACPKLDDAQAYVEKLTALFSMHHIPDVEVPYMEVPCCTGLVRIVETALQNAGSSTKLRLTKISISGDILESRVVRFHDDAAPDAEPHPAVSHQNEAQNG